MVTIIVLFALGLVLVVKGGDWFVDSSVSMARISGLPEIFIGVTIVSIATTLPEVLVSATAATKGYTTMSIGNAVGSMICNIGLILGFTTSISPSKVSSRVFNKKAIMLVLYTIILLLISCNGMISRYEAILLLGLLLIYMMTNTSILRNERKKLNRNDRVLVNGKDMAKIGVNFVIGIVAIILGSNLLISNGVILAEYLGVPEAIISLTLIALGTSLPELVTALTALKKGSTGISIGNILGANILNVTMVLGISGFIQPLIILKQNIYLDIPAALLLTFVLIVPSLKMKKVIRLQGLILLGFYISYLGILYLIVISNNIL